MATKREADAVRSALLRKLDGAVAEGAVARARRAAQPLRKRAPVNALRKASLPLSFADLTDSQLNEWIEQKVKDGSEKCWPGVQRVLKRLLGDLKVADVVALAAQAIGRDPSVEAQIATNMIKMYEIEQRLAEGKDTSGKAATVDRDRHLSKKTAILRELDMSLTDVLAKSRAAAVGKIAADITVTKSAPSAPVNNRVEAINGMLASRGQVRKVQPNGTGAGPSSTNPKPDQVDTSGTITGGMKDPKLGEGSENPIGAAANMDNGWAAVQEFFANRRAK